MNQENMKNQNQQNQNQNQQNQKRDPQRAVDPDASSYTKPDSGNQSGGQSSDKSTRR